MLSLSYMYFVFCGLNHIEMSNVCDSAFSIRSLIISDKKYSVGRRETRKATTFTTKENWEVNESEEYRRWHAVNWSQQKCADQKIRKTEHKKRMKLRRDPYSMWWMKFNLHNKWIWYTMQFSIIKPLFEYFHLNFLSMWSIHFNSTHQHKVLINCNKSTGNTLRTYST